MTDLNIPTFPGGFLCDEYGIHNNTPTDVDGLQVSRKIQKDILKVYGTFLSQDGKLVDYHGMKQSEIFRDYVESTAMLRFVDVGQLSPDERKAFFLNVYNALCIHGTVVYGGPTAEGNSIGTFYGLCRYRIGKFHFTLDDMEHGILRGNKVHNGKVPFPAGDPRAAFALELDPRIHFALVCGAKSCPPIRIFSAKNLDFGLNAAATNFLDQTVVVDRTSKTIVMSKLLMWYKEDFGDNEAERAAFIARYISDPALQGDVLPQLVLKGFVFSFSEYDWSSNGTSPTATL